jgi:hypothetical protein
VALPHRCAVLSGFSDDLASPTLIVLKKIVDSAWATADLDHGRPFHLRDVMVEVPFLLRLGNLARMNEWRRLSIVCPTFGIVVASGAVLFLKRHNILPTRACLVGLNAAYLANAALCLIVYGPMPGTARSKSGWIVTIVIVWPMLLELVWLFIQTFKTQESQDNSRADQYAAFPRS